MSIKTTVFNNYQPFSIENTFNDNLTKANSTSNTKPKPKPKFDVPTSITIKTTKGESVEEITKRALKKMTSRAGLDGTEQQTAFVEKYKNIGLSWTDKSLDITPNTGLNLEKDDIKTKSMSIDVSNLVNEVKSLQKEYVAQGGILKGGQDYTYPKANLGEGLAGKNGIDNSKHTRQYYEELARNAGILTSTFGEPTKLTDLKHYTVEEISVPGYNKEDNALASLIEDKYGKSNLWGDKKAEILEIAKSNGVKVENLTTNSNGTVSFDLTVENVLKLQHAYIGVQEKFNIDKAKADEAIANHPIHKFAQGVVDGAWQGLKANWNLVSSPWQTVKDVASGAYELGKIGIQLAAMPEIQRNALFGQLATAGFENLANMPVGEAAYKLGKFVGMAAVEIALFKGIGAVAGTGINAIKALSGTELGKTLMTSAVNLAKDVKQTVGNIPIPKGVKVVEIATTTGDKLRFPTLESAKLGDVTKMMMKSSEELEMLNNGSKAGRKTIKETAEEGLSPKAQSGMKQLKYELPKEIMAKAKEQLITINVARTELIARLDGLITTSNLLKDTKNILASARNSIKDHLTQDDLVGALRDVFGKEVRRSGDGKIYNHLGEVQDAIKSIKKANQHLLKELGKMKKGSDEFVKLSEEIDALKELKRRVENFLELK
jgi:hypothetical protein